MDKVVDVTVEVPKGSRNKYELDHDSHRFALDRMLFSAMHYPGDYGFVEETLAEDGDPLDALVILGEPTFPGCVIGTRIVGIFHMTDEKGPDDTIIGVPDSDPRWTHVHDVDDLPQHLLDEVEHFFAVYKDLESKEVATRGFSAREAALAELWRSQRRFQPQEAGA
ncbi:MAG: inorganic diphosphatase [Actinomycetota bacterium]|nr:inorganic diphosphatase [Actinomycetota bacterium]